jgi:hypothetical protein
MTMLRLLPLALLACAAPGLAAAPEAPAAQQAAEPGPVAMRLAAVAMPATLYIEREVKVAGLAFLALPGGNADSGALEKEFPGIHAAAWKALEPEVRRYAAESHPQIVKRLAQLYHEHLTGPEMEGLRTFYETPTGARILRTVFEGADYAPVVNDLVSSPEATISGDAIAAARKTALDKVAAEVQPADEAAARALLRAIPPAKAAKLTQAVHEFTVRSSNERHPEFEARVERIVTEAMQRFMER